MDRRVIVTGSRNWKDKESVRKWFGRFNTTIGSVVIVHGACSGFDQIAAEVAEEYGYTVEPHPADWDKHGKKAGPMRNQEMADSGAEYAVGFPMKKSTGTWDCLRRCFDSGIPVYIVNDGIEP